MSINRSLIFDLNRIIPENEAMAEQEIEILRQSLQQLQLQYQQDIEALRQQLVQPARAFQLTAEQILKKFDHIRTFYGKDDYSLQEFINAVENVATLCNDNEPLLRHGLCTVIKEKIQGEAKICIQRLGNELTWDMVKLELKTHFRPRKSYKKLMDESRNLKPTIYSPENNDKNLVDIVKDMINGSYRINITRGMNLINVFNAFDELDLLDEIDVIHYNHRKINRDTRYNNTSRKEFKRENREKHESNNLGRNDRVNTSPVRNHYQRQNNYNSYSGQFRRNNNFTQRNFNNNNHSGQYRRNETLGQNRSFDNNSGQMRQRPNNAEPMEIDNIQEQDVNFINQPREPDYQ